MQDAYPVQDTYPIDELDVRLILQLVDNPRIGVMELARRLGVARATAQARLSKLLDSGTVRLTVDLNYPALGHPVKGFTTLEISQGRIQEVAGPLSAIPEVLEVHSVAGTADLLVHLVATSNAGLFRVIEQALQSPAVLRTSTAISLVEHVPRRVRPFVEGLATEGQ